MCPISYISIILFNFFFFFLRRKSKKQKRMVGGGESTPPPTHEGRMPPYWWAAGWIQPRQWALPAGRLRPSIGWGRSPRAGYPCNPPARDLTCGSRGRPPLWPTTGSNPPCHPLVGCPPWVGGGCGDSPTQEGDPLPMGGGVDFPLPTPFSFFCLKKNFFIFK